jgi:PAS domain S-box-containing protein
MSEEFDSGASPSPDAPVGSVELSELINRTWVEEEFRQVWESVPDAMVVVANQGRIVLVNTMTEQLFGYDRLELLGQSIEILIPERYRDRHPTHVATYFQDPHLRPVSSGLELSGLRKDGSEFPAEINLSPLETSDGIMVCSTIRDVTKRKRADAALDEARVLAEATVETVRDPLLVLDGKLRVKAANRSFYETFQVTREETENRRVYELGNGQWDIPELRHLLERVLPERIWMNDFEVQSDFDHLGHRMMLINARALLRDGDRPALILLAIDDITDRKRVEEELSRYAAELQRSNQELEYSNRELQDFAYVVSHDLRAPLVNIQGFGKELAMSCQRLRSAVAQLQLPESERRGLSDLLDEDIPESLEFIASSSSRMDALLSGLLQLSRVGRHASMIRRLDMNQMLSEIVTSTQFAIEQTGASVQVEVLPPCQGDPSQLNQVFSNLLGNALKYLDPKRPGVIRVSGRKEPDGAVYAIEDNGIGIATEHQDAIFNIFHRLDPKHGTGEGLGLTIARRILDRHGGKIWVESRVDEGSTFQVSLPKG